MMTTEMRLERAVERAREERVRPIRLGPGQYIVASSSQLGHGYLIYVDADGTTVCNCTAAQWEFPCKHAAAVQEIEQTMKQSAA